MLAVSSATEDAENVVDVYRVIKNLHYQSSHASLGNGTRRVEKNFEDPR